MREPSRPGTGAVLCCALGAMMLLLVSCTGGSGGRPAGPAISSATHINSAGAQACSDEPAGITGFATSPGSAAGSQLVLGRISVGTGYFGKPVPVQGDGPWRYWEKRGLLILAGTGPVVISVPASWRQRAAITYGNYGIVSSLVLSTCRQLSGVWDGYAGGIYLTAAASCVPLSFAIGNRNVTVRFSVDGHCV